MLNAFKKLSQEDIEELYLIPIWVSILIAGADNKIDQSELKKAIQIAKGKQFEEDNLIIDYYKKVAQKFEVNLKGYVTLMPKNKDQRIEFLIKRLDRVNYFFTMMDMEIAHQLYLSFRDFAYKVAHASGGIFGLLSVSYAESQYIDLKMIADPSNILDWTTHVFSDAFGFNS